MSHGPTRRTALLAAAGSALALPVICSAPALATTTPTPTPGPRELPLVTHPRHPAAVYAPDAARSASPEPLNATIGCALDAPNRGGLR
ncbi:hypothetical protein ACFQLX_06660 [Streptomyces polyrhachis]|uniref:Uncharacterized protein n=1 Tax=Streptomyces polyrhachis TaxID=1282885 RepID=A0ABW2GAR7_9ACTN